jgi:hypothetical protein
MRKVLALALAAAICLAPLTARADDGDRATVDVRALPIGEQTLLVLEVTTGPGSAVELDPAAASWNGVEVIRLGRVSASERDGRLVHRLEVTVAPFEPGNGSFQPAVNVIRGSEIEQRLLPAVSWQVLETLPADAPLELSPLPAPVGIPGAQSPFLWPAIVLAVLTIAAVLALAGWLLARWWSSRPQPTPVPQAPRPAPTEIPVTPELLEADPVAAYRSMAAAVRLHLGRVYGLPAHALTTHELRRRMEGGGVDRWQARLVGGLLEECDAVVYAGYRPAPERRRADLTMAHEIVEAVS